MNTLALAYRRFGFFGVGAGSGGGGNSNGNSKSNRHVAVIFGVEASVLGDNIDTIPFFLSNILSCFQFITPSPVSPFLLLN